jgi:hypothetical protein
MLSHTTLPNAEATPAAAVRCQQPNENRKTILVHQQEGIFLRRVVTNTLHTCHPKKKPDTEVKLS